MPYRKVKVYSDGSHYIGIPYEPNPYAQSRRPHYEETIEIKESVNESEDADKGFASDNEQVSQNLTDVQQKSAPTVKRMTRKELSDELYQKSFDRKKSEQKSFIVQEMLPYFKDGISCHAFVEENFARKHRYTVSRKIWLWRKVNHQRFNYFVTFTCDNRKLTEERFAKKSFEYIKTLCKQKRLEIHGSLGMRRRDWKIAVSCNYKYS